MKVVPSTSRARAKFVFIEILRSGFSRRWGRLPNNVVSRASQALATLAGLWSWNLFNKGRRSLQIPPCYKLAQA